MGKELSCTQAHRMLMVSQLILGADAAEQIEGWAPGPSMLLL